MFVGLEQVLDISKAFNLENLWLFLNHFSVKGKEHKSSKTLHFEDNKQSRNMFACKCVAQQLVKSSQNYITWLRSKKRILV